MTLDETVADLKQHPLFMTELDESTAEDNEELAALQALAYDGTPLENAGNFREQGNECFRGKRWGDAREFYGKGVAVLVGEEQRRGRGERRKVRKEGGKGKGVRLNKEVGLDTSTVSPEDLADGQPGVEEEGEMVEEDDDPETVAAERALLETLYVNRAACHLSLSNFRSCTLDCAAALRLNPKNIKALYRSARALLAVQKIPEADDACARGLEIDPSNAPLQALAKEIIATNEKVVAKKRAEEERLAKERRKKLLLQTALEARGIKLRSSGGDSRPPDMEDARVRLAPDELDPKSALVFPTLLLYPCHAETDFIKAFSERESLAGHFGYVFPLPWDRTGEYAVGKVECYMESVSGGLVKVGGKVPLLEVLGGGKVEVVDELVKVFVVPKGRAEGWVREWKARKAGN